MSTVMPTAHGSVDVEQGCRDADPALLTVAQLGALAARIGMSLTEMVSRWWMSP